MMGYLWKDKMNCGPTQIEDSLLPTHDEPKHQLFPSKLLIEYSDQPPISMTLASPQLQREDQIVRVVGLNLMWLMQQSHVLD